MRMRRTRPRSQRVLMRSRRSQKGLAVLVLAVKVSYNLASLCFYDHDHHRIAISTIMYTVDTVKDPLHHCLCNSAIFGWPSTLNVKNFRD
eukprot:745290-Amphidinium_carterae.1